MLNFGTLWDLQYSKANLGRGERESKKFLDYKSQIGAARFMLGYFVGQNTAIPKRGPSDDRLVVVQEVYYHPHTLEREGLSISLRASIWNTMLILNLYLLLNKYANRYHRFQIHKRDRFVYRPNKNGFLSSFLSLLPMSLLTKMADLLWKLSPPSFSVELHMTCEL